MTTFVLFGSFFLFLILTVPIGIALGLSGLVTALYSSNISLTFLSQGLVTSTDSFALMAVPFFILAGEIMGKGGISTRLFDLANVFVGRFTGGFAMAAVLTCMFFAAISGSGPATVAAIGGIMIPAMVSHGYDKKFATSVIVSAGSLGIIIPPSIPLVLYGVSGNQSIGDLFMGGILPGILLGLAMMIWVYIYSKKKNYTGTQETFTFKKMFVSLNRAKWSILIPIIILGGIYGGIFTPTEAAVIAVVYAAVVSLFFHKELALKDLPTIIKNAALNSVIILIIIGTANTFGTLLSMERIPQALANSFLSLSQNSFVLLLLMVVLLLVIGCFIDTSAAVIIFTPILLPMAIEVGVDPIHFGILMIVSLAVGFITPPLGVNLFVGSGISGLGMPVLARAVVPFFFVMLLSLVILLLIPQISLAFL
ncbi:C4-dicarboxylate transporter, DctM subunit [Thalassobacillus cyri]|uniref:C4-dicarboxylate transporter, DctM subunit n=1 Tax=Thalassobacillus cyri TaxID=571932 RepID=A0A1H4E1K9_9BACI|nr:TRAP transporter large permease [Thalassobacillus cyri]SEA78911.1 C4-dicarboxylate transporter, DctM subunit [Thalassobacillus cyri]